MNIYFACNYESMSVPGLTNKGVVVPMAMSPLLRAFRIACSVQIPSGLYVIDVHDMEAHRTRSDPTLLLCKHHNVKYHVNFM